MCLCVCVESHCVQVTALGDLVHMRSDSLLHRSACDQTANQTVCVYVFVYVANMHNGVYMLSYVHCA